MLRARKMTIHAAGDFGDFSLTIAVSPPPWHQNCYIVRHIPSGEIAILDPGGDAPQIIGAVRAMKGKPVAIWLTHGHPDHLGAVREVETALSLPTIAHTKEKPVIDSADDLNRAFIGEGLNEPANLHLFDGEPDFTLGGAAVKTIFTPGHTPGGVCFDFGGFVVTGDTLFRRGVGRTDLPGGSEAALWESIGRLLGKVRDDARLYSGHGPDWGADEARRWWKMMA